MDTLKSETSRDDPARGGPWTYASGASLYCLALRHRGSHDHVVGALGAVTVGDGWVYYVGRDRRGWGRRCRRYTSDRLTPHWHIDYLLTSTRTTLAGICPVSWRATRECELLKRVQACAGTEPLTEGFGASDCSSGCPGHAVVASCGAHRLFQQLSERVPAVSGWIRLADSHSRWRSLRTPAGRGSSR